MRIIKRGFPDARTHSLTRRRDASAQPSLSVRVDGNLVGSSRCPGSLFLSRRRVGLAVERCRRQRRPAQTVYGAAQNGAVHELPTFEIWVSRSRRFSDTGS
uniref:Uncharacterized protein n=1 Tax=Calcidiscus leptoporus TaxID=127549 RepID=A0A7S0J240_9EUKA|mmetsp:Transcript_34737/g.81397  ORF Transcript_34737/g.81397 Transcript_34737/m.81397 type:complete len:101 (+) Transcript_34737:161-463(+)